MTFLPKDYSIPSLSKYMKLLPGENTIRVLSSAITGYEYWNTDNKPVRSKEIPKETPGIRVDGDGNTVKIKHFWAFIVWNYDAKAIQILEITQSSIQTAMVAFTENIQWGDPKGYDFVITRKGDGLQTEYSVVALPHSDISQEILKKAKATPINLEALYDGADPFMTESTVKDKVKTESTVKDKVKKADWSKAKEIKSPTPKEPE